MRPGYKKTEVGVIPEDWEQIFLKDVTNTVASGRSKTNTMFGEFPIFGSTGIIGLTNNPEYSGCSLLVARVGANAGKIHMVAGQYGVTDNTIILQFSTKVSQIYMFYLLQSLNLNTYVFGSGQPLITGTILKGLQIPLPPTKAEQEAIAEALGDADVWIESLEKLIAKKRLIKQGSMQQLLTGKQRLPGSEGEWETSSLIELAENKKELFDDGDWVEAEHITVQGIRLVQTGNIGVGCFIDKSDKKYINKESFQKLRCKSLQSGDLLICRLAEPAGRACVFPAIDDPEAITSVDVTICRIQEIQANRNFLMYLFSTSDWFRSVSDRSGGTTHKRISRGALGKIPFSIPSLKEQTAIAKVLSDMDNEIEVLESKLNKARKIKEGMMSELLTGKTRLVEVGKPSLKYEEAQPEIRMVAEK